MTALRDLLDAKLVASRESPGNPRSGDISRPVMPISSAAWAAVSGRESGRRRRWPGGQQWVRSQFPVHFRTRRLRRTTTLIAAFSSPRERSSLRVLAADALVVDIAPELEVVRYVRDGNLLAGIVLMGGAAPDV